MELFSGVRIPGGIIHIVNQCNVDTNTKRLTLKIETVYTAANA